MDINEERANQMKESRVRGEKKRRKIENLNIVFQMFFFFF